MEKSTLNGNILYLVEILFWIHNTYMLITLVNETNLKKKKIKNEFEHFQKILKGKK